METGVQSLVIGVLACLLLGVISLVLSRILKDWAKFLGAASLVFFVAAIGILVGGLLTGRAKTASIVMKQTEPQAEIHVTSPSTGQTVTRQRVPIMGTFRVHGMSLGEVSAMLHPLIKKLDSYEWYVGAPILPAPTWQGTIAAGDDVELSVTSHELIVICSHDLARDIEGLPEPGSPVRTLPSNIIRSEPVRFRRAATDGVGNP